MTETPEGNSRTNPMNMPKPERDDRPHWWQRSARLAWKIQCQHLHADGIYGDEINAVGGKRGYCWSCRTYLDTLPTGFHVMTPGHRIVIDE